MGNPALGKITIRREGKEAKMMKRRMLSLVMVLAMLCTLVPTAFAASKANISLDTDADDYYEFDEVYDEIVYELEKHKLDYLDYYYVVFSYDEDDYGTVLCDEDGGDDYDEVYLEDVEYLYLDIDPDDDKWEGSYEVYDDYDDQRILYGDIIIYFDGYSGDYDVELTWAYEDDYYFDNDETEEGDSVYDIIGDIVRDKLDTDDRRLIDGYYFSADRNSDDVADLEQDKDGEWYLSINDTGVWTGKWIAYEDVDNDGEYDSKEDKEILDGDIAIEITAEAVSGGDIIYTATVDDDVTMDAADFEEFWEDEYSKGTLEYVVFGSVSSRQGYLVDEDGDELSTRDKCYVDPDRNDIDLDYVTFEPKKGYAGPVSISFTAYGTSSSSSSSPKELKGTVTILYTEGEPEAITYNVQSGSVTLDGDDFLDNYKDTMGTSIKTLQIKFREVPSNGTLYYKYDEKGEVELTSKNIGSYTFSTSSSASKSIEDVTYVPDSKGSGDTIEYACYDGGELCYYGTVKFGVTVKEVTVSMSGTTAGVPFNAADFFSASQDMLNVTYMIFGTPSNGTLYKNWTGVSGTRVTASDKFSYTGSGTTYSALSTVTYVPVTGYSGTVTLPFSAFTTTGSIINGKVSIQVTATALVTFTDVATTSWSYPYITRLASLGVVGGVTATTYGAKQQVKWGEALKMVLLGAGYPKQVELTGNNWAANYLTYAYNNGIVASNKIDLTKPITRLEMAELAVKALKLQPATSVKTGITPPTDTVNGYVYTLYNLGIVGGDSSSGKNLYLPGSTLLRDEMAKIVCGVIDNK